MSKYYSTPDVKGSPLNQQAMEIAGGTAKDTLQTLLKGKSQAEVSKLEAMLKGQRTDEDLRKAKDALSSGDLPEGASLKIGDVSVGADPTAKLIKEQRAGEDHARAAAFANYNKGLPGLQKVTDSAQEMLDLINDPKQPGAKGLARTLAIRLQGMNRFNQEEGHGIVPDNFFSTFGDIVNKVTAAGDNPLGDADKRALSSQAMRAMQGIKEKHDQLKQNSMQMYNTSTYANPEHAKLIESSLGQPFDSAINSKLSKYAQTPQNPQIAPGQAPPQPGLFQRLGQGLAGVKPLAMPATPPGAMTPEQFFGGQNGQ